MSKNQRNRCWTIIVLFVFGVEVGCGVNRKKLEPAALLSLRDESDARAKEEFHAIGGKMLAHARLKFAAAAATTNPSAKPPTIDFLIISGGGDWGAFGAGFLKGWRQVPAANELAMPQFDGVTGVSTGALIAPFAFLATDESIETINHLYRNPKKDWVRNRGLLYFMPSNMSFAEVPGLERELRETVTPALAKQIAEAGADGRILAVNTTNLDDAGPRVFDLVAESQRAIETGDIDRLHKIMLASAGIPGAFPHREIDGEMYVDGGVTGNIIYGGRISAEDSLSAQWKQKYPDTPIPKIRYWVLFNNHLRTGPATVEARWMPIISRALELSTRSATVTAMRHLFAMAEISRLKYGADVEVRVVAIPGDWTPPKPGIFVKETMNNLADLGERMGADPSSWKTELP